MSKLQSEGYIRMKSEDGTVGGDDIRAKYDVTSMAGGVQGKYEERYGSGPDLVAPEPDAAAEFWDQSSALWTLIDVARSQVPATRLAEPSTKVNPTERASMVD